MTETPNSWTDGYGETHAGPPPDGYWIASDDRWYAAEFHPDYVKPLAPAEPADVVEPVMEPVVEPTHDPLAAFELADSTLADDHVQDSGPVDSGPADSGPADSYLTDGGPADSYLTDGDPTDDHLTDSDLTDSGLTDSDLTFDPSVFSEYLPHDDQPLSESNDESHLADATAPDFTGTDFTGTNFTGTNFTGTNFTGTDFSSTDFTGTDFSAGEDLNVESSDLTIPTPDAVTPDAFTPDAFTPDTFTPDPFTPDVSGADLPAPEFAAFDPSMPAPDASDATPLPTSDVSTIRPDDTATDDDKAGSSKRVLVGGLLGAIAVLGIAAAAYTVFAKDDTTTTLAAAPLETAQSSDVGTVDPVAQPVGESTEADTTPTTEAAAVNTVDLAGVYSCERIDSETLQVEMENLSDVTASYLLSVIYTDGDGERVGDDNVYIASLRAGERAIEQAYVFSDAGVGCDVVDVDRYDRDGVEGLADISACTIREPGVLGTVEADVSATNSGDVVYDYTIEVAFVGPDDVRRGVGTTFIEQAPVGEAVPGAVYSSVPFDEALRCEVVAVSRFESN